ncbi:sulfotransferase family protein [Salinibacter ruber]|uniref:sulfotransferase family protein n=1 Tax=Salinibacter ruber TaxID=146919 RepID=UPI0020748FFE|nr:sulfotransferase [Salinibacter ruber]
MKPDFLIVGAMKSGTSTLAHYLRQHPEVYMPVDEVHFFYEQGRGNWQKGFQWYESQFHEASPSQIAGEKTPTYSYLPGTAERIHEVLPNVKLLWIFRDPIDRAYSNYWHAVCAGVESKSFAEAVRLEEQRIKKSPWKGYVRRSIYSEQVERYLDYFDQNQMHFCLLENLKEKPNSVLKDLAGFLGVDSDNFVSDVRDDRKNMTYVPRFPLLRYAVRSIFGQGSLVGRIEKRVNKREEPGYPEMSSKIRSDLEGYFAPYNNRLKELTGIDLEA